MPAALLVKPAPARIPARRLLVVALATLLTAGLFAAPADAAVATSLTTPAAKSVEQGTAARFGTRLTAGGNAVAYRTVKLLAYYSGSWRYVKSAKTVSTGYAAFSYAPTATRAVKIVFSGDSKYAASRTAVFRVTVTAVSGSSIVTEASRHRGKPYSYGATGPDRFDCSGFTGYVYRRLGKSLPRTSGMQRGATRRISASERRPGDLAFVHSSSGSVTHVAIYAGDGLWWEAAKPGTYVRRVRIWSSRVSYGRL